MREEQIQLTQIDTIHTTTIIIDREIKATVTILQKSTITNIIHRTKDNI